MEQFVVEPLWRRGCVRFVVDLFRTAYLNKPLLRRCKLEQFDNALSTADFISGQKL